MNMKQLGNTFNVFWGPWQLTAYIIAGVLTKQIEEVRKENKDLARELDSVHKDHRADVEVLEGEIKNLEGLIDKDQEELEQQAHQIVVLTH